MTKQSLATDFIRSYAECFPKEKEDLYDLFSRVTHYTTVSEEARGIFGKMYRLGRKGDRSEVNRIIKERNNLVSDLQLKMLSEQISLNEAVYKEIWIVGSKEISPTPWEPGIKEKYRFNINTTTVIDFFSLDGVSFDIAEKLTQIREQRHGFNSITEFNQIRNNIYCYHV